MIREKIFTFGTERNLTGVVTIPDAGIRKTDRPAILFLNAGFLHQVGPHRMTVDLCRALSRNQFISFRFDLSGIGDSPSSFSKTSNEEQVLTDIKDAMNLVQKKHDVARFIIGGLCTGADNAHKIAVEDSRVCGLFQMDGYAYPTTRFEANRHISILTDPKRLTKYLLRKANFMKSDNRTTIAKDPVGKFIPGWNLPPYQQTQLEMAKFIHRKVKLLLIFSGAWIWQYNYQGQARDMYSPLEFGDCLEEIFNIEADHTYMLKRDREKLQFQIISWVVKHFGHLDNK